jgi:hypothetical protein
VLLPSTIMARSWAWKSALNSTVKPPSTSGIAANIDR